MLIYGNILLLLSFSTGYGQTILTCPSVENIKNKQFQGWLPLYIDGEELAREEDKLQFIQDVSIFISARWSRNYLENAHCFYEGGPTTKRIVFAHDAWQPGNTPDWHWTDRKIFAECNGTLPKLCPFLS